jgi:hypothetical protein
VTAHARIKCTIWRDEDFRDLSVDAQWTYQRLLSDSSRDLTGVLALTRKRWVASANGMTRERLDAALDELIARTFIVLDEDTEEVLVRSYLRHNDIAAQPNVLKSALKQARRIESPLLRAALAVELRLLPPKPADTERMAYGDPHAVAEEIDPGPLWARLSVVREAPARQDVSAGSAHHSKGSANPSAKGAEREKELVKVSRGGVGGTQSALAVQSPLLVDVAVSPPPPRVDKSRGTRLPEGWLPSEAVREWTLANSSGVDVRAELSKFQDYWLAKPGAAGRKVNWDATWRNWVRRAAEMRPAATRKPDGTPVAPIDQRVLGMMTLTERYEREEALAAQQRAILG